MHSLSVVGHGLLVAASFAWMLVSHVVSGRVFEFFWSTDDDL